MEATNTLVEEGSSAIAAASSERSLPRIDNVGITEVYCPPTGTNPIADIVFIHGLMGHPRKTWQYGEDTESRRPETSADEVKKRTLRRIFSRSKTTPNKDSASDGGPANVCFWPFDLLPNANVISDTRIMLYGYDSHPTHFYKTGTNRMNITQHSEDLLRRVAGKRSECRGRPLFSVGKIVGALPGGFTTYTSVLKGLNPDSETLYAITRGFNDMLDNDEAFRGTVKICCVQEGKGLGNAKGLGSLSRSRALCPPN